MLFKVLYLRSKEPIVFAGNDDTVCEDGTYTVTDATYDFAASIPPSADFSGPVTVILEL